MRGRGKRSRRGEGRGREGKRKPKETKSNQTEGNRGSVSSGGYRFFIPGGTRERRKTEQHTNTEGNKEEPTMGHQRVGNLRRLTDFPLQRVHGNGEDREQRYENNGTHRNKQTRTEEQKQQTNRRERRKAETNHTRTEDTIQQNRRDQRTIYNQPDGNGGSQRNKHTRTEEHIKNNTYENE